MSDKILGLTASSDATMRGLTSFLPVANIAALRALTSSSIVGQRYIYVASYYAADGAASDGGGGVFEYIAGDTTTPDDGMVYIVSTAPGWRWKRVFDRLNVLQVGCKNDGALAAGSRTDNAPKVQAALNAGYSLFIPQGVNIGCSNIYMNDNVGIYGIGNKEMCTITLIGTASLYLGKSSGLSTSGVTIRGITITSTDGGGGGGVIYATGSGSLRRMMIADNLLVGFSSAPCVQINQPCGAVNFMDNFVLGNSYGYLQNIQSANAGSGLVISGNNISVTGDAIEINTPVNGLIQDVSITNNVVWSTGFASAGSFGIGVAKAKNLTIAGNNVRGGAAGIHIEDGELGITVVGNTVLAVFDGIWINNGPDQGNPVIVEGNQIYGTVATSTASSISATTLTVGGTVTGTFRVGQTLYGPGIAVGTTISALGTGTGGAGTYTVSISQTLASGPISGGGNGLYSIFNASVVVPRTNFSNNDIHGFVVGAYLNGPTHYGFDNNLISDCPIGIRADGGNTPGGTSSTRLIGTTRMHNVQIAASLPGGAVCGKIIFDDAGPVSLLSKTGAIVPGPVLEGFSILNPALGITASGAKTINAFPAPAYMHGLLRVIAGNGGSADGFYRREEIDWDGTTYAAPTLKSKKDYGALVSAASSYASGNVQINLTASAASSNQTASIDFEGDYCQ